MKKLDSFKVAEVATLSVVIINGSEAENMRIDRMLMQQTVDTSPISIIERQHSSATNVANFPLPANIHCIIFIYDQSQNASPKAIKTLRTQHPNTPIIVIISAYDTQLTSEVISHGAQECITQHDVSIERLHMLITSAQTRLHAERHWQQSLNEARAQAIELEKIAHIDCLTHIPNRASFNNTISRRLYNAMQTGKPVALIYLDLNDFKYVNDTFGHDVGDELLQQVADRLQQTCRSTDFLARLGGDEFAILTEQMDYRCEVFGLVDRLVKTFESPFHLSSTQLTCRPAIGIAFYPEAQTPELLSQQADAAMYLAKNKLTHPVCFYTRKMRHQFSRSLQINTQLLDAVAQQEFDVHFQQVVDNHDDQHLVYEALLRWDSVLLGPVTPNEFMPALQKKALLNDLTLLVLQKSALLFSLAPAQQKITIKINVTPAQISSLQYIKQLIQQVEELAISPEQLCLEVSSQEIGPNPTRLLAGFNLLKDSGIQLSLDNFGVDDVSLDQLLNIPIDILSFDKRMIKSLLKNSGKRAMVAGVVEMAHQLGIGVCAEGIEKESEHNMVNKLGCDFQQGYYYAHPQPVKALF